MGGHLRYRQSMAFREPEQEGLLFIAFSHKLQELEDNAKALQTQNTYLASRVDGQEEDKGALKAEIKSQNQQLEDTMRANAELSEKERVPPARCFSSPSGAARIIPGAPEGFRLETKGA